MVTMTMVPILWLEFLLLVQVLHSKKVYYEMV